MNREEEINNAAYNQYEDYAGHTSMEIFKRGAKWADTHLKNPWISVKDRLPESDDLMITGCWCTDYFKYIQRGLYDKNSGEWRDDCGNVICVTHYMPIVEPK